MTSRLGYENDAIISQLPDTRIGSTPGRSFREDQKCGHSPTAGVRMELQA
jgi:hypothetical protein